VNDTTKRPVGDRGFVRIESGVGGRVFESFDRDGQERVIEPSAFVRMIGLWWGDLLTSMRMHSDAHRLMHNPRSGRK
jgi:hypothetical protein